MPTTTHIYARTSDGDWTDMTPGATDGYRAAFLAVHPDISEEDLDALFDVHIEIATVELDDDEDLSTAAEEGWGTLLGRLRITDGLPSLETPGGPPSAC